MKRLLLILLLMISLALSVQAYDSSEHLLKVTTYDGRQNMFLSTHDSMLNFLIPAIMLFVVLVSFAVDYGTVGVTSMALLSLVLLRVIGIIYVDIVSFSAFIVMMIILILKINQK